MRPSGILIAGTSSDDRGGILAARYRTWALLDGVEGRVTRPSGSGCCPFGSSSPREVLARPTGSWRGHPVEAYEIRHGIASRIASDRPAHPLVDGSQSRSVRVTTWHVAFEGDGFCRVWLAETAPVVGSRLRPEAGAPGVAQRRERMLDTLADALEQRADIDALIDLTRADTREFAV